MRKGTANCPYCKELIHFQIKPIPESYGIVVIVATDKQYWKEELKKHKKDKEEIEKKLKILNTHIEGITKLIK